MTADWFPLNLSTLNGIQTGIQLQAISLPLKMTFSVFFLTIRHCVIIYSQKYIPRNAQYDFLLQNFHKVDIVCINHHVVFLLEIPKEYYRKM